MATADPAHLEGRVRAAEVALAAHYGRTLVEHLIPTAAGSTVRVVEYPAIGASDAAAGLPPILLLHGIASVTALAVPLLGALADRRVLAVDWPGHGLSGADVLPTGTALRAHAVAGVEEVMAFFQVAVVDAIGHSLGGQVALYAAVAHPERLRKLVLLGAPGAAFSQARATWGMRVASIPGLGTAVLGLSTSSRAHARAVDRLLGAGVLDGSPPEINEIGFLASQRPEFAASVASLFRAMMTPFAARADVALTASELAHLAVPTLIVWGQDDAILTPAHGRASAEAIPKVAILEVEGGHAPWLNEPDRVGDAVSAFSLSRV
ncbi:MAG TPA: alpha/beta hydrolase [Pseudolysinimonas sp.]|nr:alpha/beta hydrolase [Pseudolysinimonas sp.]